MRPAIKQQDLKAARKPQRSRNTAKPSPDNDYLFHRKMRSAIITILAQKCVAMVSLEAISKSVFSAYFARAIIAAFTAGISKSRLPKEKTPNDPLTTLTITEINAAAVSARYSIHALSGPVTLTQVNFAQSRSCV